MWSSGNISHKQVPASQRCRVLQVTHSSLMCATGCHYPVLGRYLTNSGCQDISMSTRTRSNDQIVAGAASIHTRVHSVCRSANCEYVNIGVNRCSTAHIAVRLMCFPAYLDVKSTQVGQKMSSWTRVMPCDVRDSRAFFQKFFGKISTFPKRATGHNSSPAGHFLTNLGAFDI